MKGKLAVVTGAGSGIGRATTLLLAREGAHVLAADVNIGAAEETAALADGLVTAAELDVAEEPAVAELFARCRRELGPPDVLANIAGIGSTTNAPDTPVEVWDRVFAVNARGTFLCCKHAIPLMVAAGGGSIVNMASVAGLVGLRNRAAYCASKGAVVAFTRALALDHVADRVRVNCICPGTVDSPWVRRLLDEVGEPLEGLVARQPMGRLGTPEEIAAAVLYVASDAAAFMTGSALTLDGGLTAG
ncbi:MAG TPA: SDR family oxidoreductase [Solirubrobacteraceae bacterium]|jgi:NAD(P)-dependent dehydrogenase (short-subunit alcohol dehydrogenase family)|nr:SDR family oxidoreductase [Solirubrobacteraceae bacterium]